jgi:hypothetical protein
MVIKKKVFKVIVKPNAPENKVISYDEVRDGYRIAIKERAEQGKANREIVKFLSKLLKKKVEIIKGLKSREKILRVVE